MKDHDIIFAKICLYFIFDFENQAPKKGMSLMGTCLFYEYYNFLITSEHHLELCLSNP